MNRQSRFVKNQVKDRVKQRNKTVIDAACCYYCKNRGILYGHFSDAVDCVIWGKTVAHVKVCHKFERRE